MKFLTRLRSLMGLKSVWGEDVAFGRIDAHTHIHRSTPALIFNMEKYNWRALSICVWEQFDDRMFDTKVSPGFKTLDELHQATAKIHRESNGRVAWAATIDARGFESPDFSERTIASLQQCFKDGAIAVKIWKIIGMK